MSDGPRVRVLGAGVAGLAAAFEFARADCRVELIERREAAGLGCSHLAGGMLAPWCEAESSEQIIVDLGVESIEFWTHVVPVAERRGTLVLAAARDRPELARYARRTLERESLDGAAIAALEPDLSGRFEQALFYPREAHLDPRAAMAALLSRLKGFANVALRFGVEASPASDDADWTIDCRGLDSRDRLQDLRGVKGEMLILATPEVNLSRPVWLLHPRQPVYIVPRGGGRFMVGATMIENDEPGRITARAMLELLGAAYTVHPAFAEAEIVETGCGVRPAFPDNLPRLRREGRVIHVNGLFRHGFLIAPALARRAARMALDGAHFPEVTDADPRQRQSA
ncbi:glycine oxidase ThiO [Methylocapsa palsarum]|uniref:Glycine oxidase n=1 Tax=Methylocapsa palsarum TaxID=1612308 RepID=A0A1I3XSW7_9HYPH|nr:glycine oxidase ThiO [Methylocapsa palsarum]SFK22076.1 glycine oxidase [Methylocapsa palsarum]